MGRPPKWRTALDERKFPPMPEKEESEETEEETEEEEPLKTLPEDKEIPNPTSKTSSEEVQALRQQLLLMQEQEEMSQDKIFRHLLLRLLKDQADSTKEQVEVMKGIGHNLVEIGKILDELVKQ